MTEKEQVVYGDVKDILEFSFADRFEHRSLVYGFREVTRSKCIGKKGKTFLYESSIKMERTEPLFVDNHPELQTEIAIARIIIPKFLLTVRKIDSEFRGLKK